MKMLHCLCIFIVLQHTVTSLEDYVRYYETASIKPTLVETSSKHLTAYVHFSAHGKNFHLHLGTNQNLFAPGFRLRVIDKDGKIQIKNPDTRHIVIGHVIGDSNSIAHGKISQGVFEGVIHTAEEIYHVEHIKKYFNNTIAGPHNTVVYKASDVNFGHPTLCGNDNHINKLKELQESANYLRKHKPNRLKKRQAINNLDTCTMHIYADYEFYTNVGNSDEATTFETMALHITEANVIYRGTDFNDGSIEYGVAILYADIISTNDPSSNPLYGSFAVDELLQAFAVINFNSVCLGHLFTYRDFSGTVGLAYVADPTGRYDGGICQQRTQTYGGELNLNTGLTTLLNFGRRLPQGVSIITTTHEIGHNFGSPHDPSGECSPGGSQGNYIMYATATDGTLPNNRKFSTCSRTIMSETINAKGTCFVAKPFSQICGNNIVEGTEECDCGSNDTCTSNDPCCKPGECLLTDTAKCSPHKYSCCTIQCELAEPGTICNLGDECLETFPCTGTNESCPAPSRKDLTSCNDGNNVCVDGVCSGSVCLTYDAIPCFCSEEDKLCDVCCQFTSNGPCVSTYDYPSADNATIQSGFPCKNFTGYCDDTGVCIFVDTNTPLDDLRNLIPSFTSIVNWLKDNWYWVLAGVILTVIVIILLQVTYRRKKLKNKNTDNSYQQQTDEVAENLRLLEQRRRENEATRL